jgi:peptide-methionine (R)-S-oxide reductase
MMPFLTQETTRRQALLRALSLAGAVSIARAEDPDAEVTIVEFNDAGKKIGPVKVKKVFKTEDEWRKVLTLQQLYVTRKQQSDLPYYGTYFKLHDAGLYRCICCSNAVFSSDAKFDSPSGLPCFTAPIAEENVRTHVDTSEEPRRVEVLCKRCDAHLGFVFNDGPEPTHLRYCANESAMKFIPRPKSGAGA